MKKLLYALFLLLPYAGMAQPEFDQRLDFDRIKAMLTEGIGQKDLRKQAMAWYHWAYYDEEQTGLSDSAFQYLTRSADRFVKAGDSLAYHRVRADLADRLSARDLYDEAIKMQQEALSFAERTNNLYLKTHLLARLSRIYSDKGDVKNSLALRRAFTKENQALKDTVLDLIVAKYEVEHNGQLGKYAIARYEASNALRLAEQIKRPDYITWAQYSVGKYSILDRDYNMALFFLKKAEKTAPRTNISMRRDICRELSSAYSSMDSLEQALYYATRAMEIGDTLIAEEREAALHRVAMQFDTREKRREIAQLEKEKSEVEEQSKQQQKGLFTMAATIAALILSFIVVVRDYKHRIRMDKIVADQKQEIDRQKIRDLENNLKIETMQSMLAGQESERQRVAQDLHDSVGGLLAAVKIQMETINAKKPALSKDDDWIKIRKLLDETVSETRHIARNMQPSALLEFGLVTALRDLTSRVHGQGMPQLTFQHFGDFSDLDRDLALNCYRIIQELVQNSLKHAQANEILVQITRTEDEIALHVEDDGKGFDPKATQKGMGTDNLARRAQFLKAELSVQSAVGQGTSTVVTVPLGKTQGKP